MIFPTWKFQVLNQFSEHKQSFIRQRNNTNVPMVVLTSDIDKNNSTVNSYPQLLSESDTIYNPSVDHPLRHMNFSSFNKNV